MLIHAHGATAAAHGNFIALTDLDPATVWPALFGNDQPVYVEVGPGRGEFLLHTATANPTRNYFAVERSRARVREIGRALAKRRDVHNVRVVDADAACLLALLPTASVAGYHVLFPDPWWKRRHERRRMMTPHFVQTLSRTLVRQGTITFATDVADYFAVAQQCFDEAPDLERLEAGASGAPSTSFSRKAQRRGVPIYVSVHRRR